MIIYALYTIIGLIVKPTNYVLIEEGTIAMEESVVGYIIREETLLKNKDRDKNIIPIKTEGEKVAKNQKIARYYNSDEPELLAKIDRINNKIQEAIKGTPDLFSSDIKVLDAEIEKNIESMKKTNNLVTIRENKKDINKYIEKKSVIAGELSQSGSYIKKLINQREKIERQISSGSEYIKAPKSGIVSYRVDNLEDVLSIKSIETIDRKTLEKLEIKTGQMVTSSDQKGKIINNFSSYIAVAAKSNEAKEAEVRR